MDYYIIHFNAMRKFIATTVVLLCTFAAEAKVSMPQMFQSGMVVQRNKPIPVWGNANPGESVSVTFRKKKYETTADTQGHWRIDLLKQKAGGPYTIVVEGNSDDSSPITLDNVLVGDVWLCSGQSNIDVTIERVYPQYGKVIDEYENSEIRMFRVQTDTDTHGPKADIKPTPINWKPVNRQNAWLFSAAGYFLGREMYAKTGVPQGIIVNSVGGTPIQAWLDADTLRQYYPQEYQRTLFFQDDDMVRSLQRANMQAQNRWQKMLTDTDPGFAEGFTARDYDDSQWPLLDAFITKGGRQLSNNLTKDFRYTGSFWARQHVTIDAAHAGQKARLLVGTLYDADQTYVNGKQVGSTGYQYPPRRYTIPEGLLVTGDNALTVRFVTKGGAPHFIPEKPYKLIFDDGTEVALSPQWRGREGMRMPQCPSADAGGQNLPSVLYNAMHYPLAPYALSGMVWYQGESNTGNPRPYEHYLTMLVTGWRQLWQQPDLPFTIVQLANHDGRQQTGNPSPLTPQIEPQPNSGWAQLREAQRLVAKKLDNVELASAIDLGEPVDIHPLRKREVAERIGLCFDRTVYHDKKVKLMPEIVGTNIDGRTVTLTFDQPLRPNLALCEFEVAGSDGHFSNAAARAVGNTVIIDSPIDNPIRVRHAWKDNPIQLNAYSQTGLPIGPFEISL